MGLLLGVLIVVVQQTEMASAVLARIDEERRVVLLDVGSRKEQVIYRSQAHAAYGLRFSPAAGRLAIVESTRGRDGDQESFKRRLAVMDRSGTVLFTLGEDVQVYTWCGEDCVAYITGVDSEDRGFIPRGVFVRSPLRGSSTEITGVPAPRSIGWAPFNDSIYVVSNRRTVYRASVTGGSAVATRHKGIGFSPSGKYYLHQHDYGDVRLYWTETDTLVPLPEAPAFGEMGGWAFDHGDYLVFGKRPRPATPSQGIRRGRPGPVEYTIYDVNNRRVVRRLSWAPTQWTGPRGVLPILVRGRVQVLSMP